MVVCTFNIFTTFFYLRWYLSIVWYVSENVLLSNFWTQQLSSEYSLVMLMSFPSELISGSLIKMSTVSLSYPFIYLIVGAYSSNSRRQRSTFSALKLSSVRFLWSIYTFIRCPKRIIWNYYRVSAILNSYCYIVV